MNPYLICGLVLLLMIIVWVISAERYYKMGYKHAIEDIKLVDEFIKNSKKLKDEE